MCSSTSVSSPWRRSRSCAVARRSYPVSGWGGSGSGGSHRSPGFGGRRVLTEGTSGQSRSCSSRPRPTSSRRRASHEAASTSSSSSSSTTRWRSRSRAVRSALRSPATRRARWYGSGSPGCRDAGGSEPSTRPCMTTPPTARRPAPLGADGWRGPVLRPGTDAALHPPRRHPAVTEIRDPRSAILRRIAEPGSRGGGEGLGRGGLDGGVGAGSAARGQGAGAGAEENEADALRRRVGVGDRDSRSATGPGPSPQASAPIWRARRKMSSLPVRHRTVSWQCTMRHPSFVRTTRFE